MDSKRQFKQLLLMICLVGCTTLSYAQRGSREYKSFSRVATEANVVFNIPEGFKELPARQNSLTYDFGMNIPGQSFEIWLKVIPLKNEQEVRDSTLDDLGRIEARTLAGEENYFMREMTEDVLADYNADAGRTFLINLPDNAATKHFKYALLIVLQKRKEGTIMAICLTNDKGPDFFRNIIKARSCVKFNRN